MLTFDTLYDCSDYRLFRCPANSTVLNYDWLTIAPIYILQKPLPPPVYLTLIRERSDPPF